jgi:SAM-dependent methyltransferase
MASEPIYADPQRYIDLVGFDGGWRDLWWNRDYLDLCARRFQLGDVRRALDVGCGAGHWGRTLLALLAADAQLTGVDREQAFLDFAAKHDDARTSYVVGSVEALPFADDSFDLVTCQTVLIHVADPAAAIAEMTRVLKPGGLLLAAEPDNRAGNVALLGGEPRIADEDIAAILAMLLRCDRGKAALGEGDQSIGGRLPGLFAAGGLTEVMAYNNDRCMTMYPPYERGDMRVAIEQERAWRAQDASVLCGAREDNWRFFEAGDGTRAAFDACWSAVDRWMTAVAEGIDAGSYHAGRGFIMYLVAARKAARAAGAK